MVLYDQIAQFTYAVIDFIAFEVLLSAIYVVHNGQVKFTVDWLFGLSKYQKTERYVYPVLILGVIYFYSSNILQNRIISTLAAQGSKTLPALTLAISIAIFWLAKINLGRSWDFELVKYPLITGGLSIAALIFL